MKSVDRKLMYFLVGCVCFALAVIGATYAYFTANVTDFNTVKGDAATVTFGLSVERVTTVDMAYGLVPMKNSMAPNAARQMCRDDFGNAGCQMYKMTIKADSDTVMFLDGYVVITPRDERLETRFSIVKLDEDGNFYTDYTKEDIENETFDVDKVIKNGIRVSDEIDQLNQTDDYGCLLVENEKIGGDVGREKVFYMMIWVYDNAQAQDYLQGMVLANKGEVTFMTAEGNEISATFD
ncbi:MAG: hypothetical protein IJ509_00275 [Bacilli bacterium]|nr:hypothetical protein [Bacilli bacterium]